MCLTCLCPKQKAQKLLRNYMRTQKQTFWGSARGIWTSPFLEPVFSSVMSKLGWGDQAISQSLSSPYSVQACERVLLCITRVFLIRMPPLPRWLLPGGQGPCLGVHGYFSTFSCPCGFNTLELKRLSERQRRYLEEFEINRTPHTVSQARTMENEGEMGGNRPSYLAGRGLAFMDPKTSRSMGDK